MSNTYHTEWTSLADKALPGINADDELKNALCSIAKHVRHLLNPELHKSLSSFGFQHLSRAVYVWPKGSRLQASRGQDLQTLMDAFATHKKQRVAVILGNPGAGKTLFAKRW